MSEVSPLKTPPSPLPILVEKTTTPDTPATPNPNFEEFELGYSSIGVATVASVAFAIASFIPTSLQLYAGYTALTLTSSFWIKESVSTLNTREYSLAAKQLTLASLLLLPVSFYSFTLQDS